MNSIWQGRNWAHGRVYSLYTTHTHTHA